ncbi:MAG: regulatory protein RecX [Dehalococcoidia bacterium]|nr:regulatory protein RecX [Dehalococcoidia bacterium]
MDESAFQQAMDAALRYLSPRPRSVWEVQQRLKRRGLAPEDIDAVISRLRELGYLDDDSFAAFWIENRESFQPRGRRLLAQELRLRGVDTQAIEERLSAIDEEDGAMRAARKKAQGLSGAGYAAFTARVGSFLQRRGFSYDVITPATRRLWAEVALSSPEGDSYHEKGEGEEDQD